MKKLVLGSLILMAATPWPAQAQEGKTLPPGIFAQMKKGQKLDRVWMNPKFDTSTGFQVGKVSTEAEGYWSNTIDYFPYALNRLTIPGSTNLLSLTVTDMRASDRYASGIATAIMDVEGQIVDRDGNLLFAFVTREECSDRETALKNCQADMDRIVWQLAKEMGKPLQDALAVKMGVDKGLNASGLVPSQPKGQEGQTLSTGERLIQLDNLRKNGLINDAEYEQKRAEILKGL